ncbi:GDSL-type esterase/lipase family protein [Lipingzhangella sp. LS1_29]|uniref:GDSL-type esterase/lipase family protein n=1 Tax=Lipingzhangella rawalii TaxID=2055835 RepID=A0ABU2HAB3_9ACTN|nr:GDSL-type esterase/lipase family protein [Lipingzhangella rawalii]MDS1272211.1 GDSL-type esterase/lipase family protein [Lipingzhangella rawalii]
MAATLLVIQLTVGTFRLGSAPEAESASPEATPPGEHVLLMPVGDSITQGSTGDHTWRYWLWQHLDAEADHTVEFVGPFEDVANLDPDTIPEDDPGYVDTDFDREHASVWGATAEVLAADVGAHVAEFEPDYLLVLAGVNDLRSGQTPEETIGHIRDLVDTARVARGDIQVVLGQLTPVWGTDDDEEFNADIHEVNRALPRLANDLTGANSPVILADTAADYDPDRDNWDAIHPNSRGQQRIAAAFADALAGQLELGAPYPRPLPEVEVGPRTAPEITADIESQDTVTLSWDPVPGATDYQVWQRREDPDPDELVRLPAEVVEPAGTTPSATISGLFAGATYTFYVDPLRGDDVGERSQRVEITMDEETPSGPAEVSLEDEVLDWSAVAEASHYAVWRRALDCEDADADAGGDAAEPGEPGCVPRDEEEPDPDRGWSMVAVVEEGTEWETGAAPGYEFAVRSHRDYVAGGFSESVARVDEAADAGPDTGRE